MKVRKFLAASVLAVIASAGGVLTLTAPAQAATHSKATHAKPLKSCTAALDAAEKLGTKSELYQVNAQRCRTGINDAEQVAAKAGPHTPIPADFSVNVIILRQACFGSAGCNVTYRVDVSYVGSQTPDPSKTYRVTYDLQGGEDPQIGSFEITGTKASVDSEDTISTAGTPVLTAVPTQVIPN